MSSYLRYHPEALSTLPKIHGHCHPQWEPVRDAFQDNFRSRLERGAAVAVYHRGERVVDLWGGERGAKGPDVEPWQHDTICNVFSAGKGIVGIALAWLHSHGHLDYDAPVAQYWTEFGCNGKEKVLVRHLLGHMVGVCCVEEKLTEAVLRDPIKLSAALAATKMEWAPEDNKNGYAALTIGWYADCLCRRVDPRKRSLDQLIRDELLEPLGLSKEMFIGLPPEDELPRASRVATLNAFGVMDMIVRSKLPKEFVSNFVFHPSSYAARCFKNPDFLGEPSNYNSEKVRTLCVPAGNMHASARAIAACYDLVLRPGRSRDGRIVVDKTCDRRRGSGVMGDENEPIVSASSLSYQQCEHKNGTGNEGKEKERDSFLASPPSCSEEGVFSLSTLRLLSDPSVPVRFDEVVRVPSCFHLCFTKPVPHPDTNFLFGSSSSAFGATGTGGQFGFADPDQDLTFAYVTSRLGLYMLADPRELAVRQAVYEVLRTLKAQEVQTDDGKQLKSASAVCDRKQGGDVFSPPPFVQSPDRALATHRANGTEHELHWIDAIVFTLGSWNRVGILVAAVVVLLIAAVVVVSVVTTQVT